MSIHQPVVEKELNAGKNENNNFQHDVAAHVRHGHVSVMAHERAYETFLPFRFLVHYPCEVVWRSCLVTISCLDVNVTTSEQEIKLPPVNVTPS
jgi:hypothetical protein